MQNGFARSCYTDTSSASIDFAQFWLTNFVFTLGSCSLVPNFTEMLWCPTHSRSNLKLLNGFPTIYAALVARHSSLPLFTRNLICSNNSSQSVQNQSDFIDESGQNLVCAIWMSFGLIINRHLSVSECVMQQRQRKKNDWNLFHFISAHFDDWHERLMQLPQKYIDKWMISTSEIFICSASVCNRINFRVANIF